MAFISSTNFSIITNGKPRGKIKAMHGLRQRDPLSPFLFTLVVDFLSRMVSKGLDSNIIENFAVRNSSLSINQLQFLDDIILFFYPNEEKLENLFEVIHVLNTHLAFTLTILSSNSPAFI